MIAPQQQPRILIVDDDPVVAESLAEFLGREGYATATAGDGSEALTMLAAGQRAPSPRPDKNGQPAETLPPFGVLITDINMPRSGGIDLLRTLRKQHDAVVPVVITGFGKIETAVEAIKLGAVDYLIKPVVDDELRVAVQKAVRQHALLHENRNLRAQLAERYGLESLVGADYRMQKVYDLIEAVAASKTTVLINGDSGTGKTMVARAIHTRSPRSGGPFITFACGAIPETLLESELFGHVKGAFTGADTDKPGKLIAANGGTLFIDEINSATPALQLKLLRVLQERQFEPVGSTQTISVDVRFILATNQMLLDLVRSGSFREDLYYRINVVSILVPPLRDRTGDIPLLAQHFLTKYCAEAGKTITGFTAEAAAALTRYKWPGNVRELENAVERAVVLSRRPIIELDDLPDPVRLGELPGAALPGGGNGNGRHHNLYSPALEGGWHPTPLEQALLDPEKQIIRAALESNGWNRQETARQLNINRTTLYKKMRLFGMGEN